jgi:Na+/proline symporter
MLTQSEGLLLIVLFGLVMLGVSWFTRKKNADAEDFLVMGRTLGPYRGAISIAASWIWAPAIFIVSAQAYNQGLPGVFWFTVPNILCFFVFAAVAVRLRHLMPNGCTLPEFIANRFPNYPKAHIAALCVFIGYQLGAFNINSGARGLLINLLTGIDFHIAVLIMAGTAITYASISGLRASVATDVVQMTLILVLAFVLVPWLIIEVGGFATVSAGFAGQSGNFGDVFDPGVAFAFGIAMTLGLIAGPIADQMFFQRAFAVKKDHIVKVFVLGGLAYGLVPIMLSFLGFAAASPEIQQSLTVSDPQMVGPTIIGAYLPKWALMMFAVMAFAGLTSTLDSAYCAVGSIGSVDVYSRYVATNPSQTKLLNAARKAMLVISITGTFIALLQPKLLWVFLIYGALASSAFFPVIFSIFSTRLTEKGFFGAIVTSLVLGMPLSIYANVTGNTNMIVLASILSVSFGLVICAFSILTNNSNNVKSNLDVSTIID